MKASDDANAANPATAPCPASTPYQHSQCVPIIAESMAKIMNRLERILLEMRDEQNSKIAQISGRVDALNSSVKQLASAVEYMNSQNIGCQSTPRLKPTAVTRGSVQQQRLGSKYLVQKPGLSRQQQMYGG